MIHQSKIAILLIILIYIGLCCSSSENNDSSKYSDALIIIKGATSLSYYKYRGTDQLIYKIETPYPATQAINELYEKLKAKGWEPLKEDYLNPGLPSSHVRGWTDFIDCTVNPARRVHQWLAQWENSNKDILWCTLRYSYPEGKKPDLNNLNVYLSFIPSKLAIEGKNQVINSPKNNNVDPTK